MIFSGGLATMRKMPTVWQALIAGVISEFLLLALGGFDLRVGGDGPASKLLFITHLPAGALCTVLPVPWQTEIAVIVANAMLFWGIAFVVISVKRIRWRG
jgi:hypothetical protein